MIGSGRYGDVAQVLIDTLPASAVLVIVVDGPNGDGAAIKARAIGDVAAIPEILRQLADEIDADVAAHSKAPS